MLNHSVAFDIHNFTGKAALAPMAGAADRAFRELCISFGAAFCVSELVSAKGVALGDKKSRSLLDVSEKERPYGLQLFGDDPAVMCAAAREAARNDPDFIDINMGCPAQKVVANGGGSALLNHPALVASIVAAVRNAVPARIPVSVKIRAGWDSGHINAVEIAKLAEEAGAAFITVHGRTRVQQYRPPVDLAVIRAVKQAVNIPVVGNGDVFSPKDAANMLEQTGCDMVMCGRGALGAPWLFAQISAWLNHEVNLPEPPLTEKLLVLCRQARRTAELKGEEVAAREIRKHAAWYIKGMPGAARLRARCGKLCGSDDLKQLVAEILEKSSVA
ncbi:MAG: tRNA dihydrouridine synthase DusB [Oscillospiraceae bacterium]|jgi:nifR3 family TIM-barrel protein|nr:tRNA dihydrouridine synthase DusB [Oscillospiraceae bacterium]